MKVTTRISSLSCSLRRDWVPSRSVTHLSYRWAAAKNGHHLDGGWTGAKFGGLSRASPSATRASSRQWRLMLRARSMERTVVELATGHVRWILWGESVRVPRSGQTNSCLAISLTSRSRRSLAIQSHFPWLGCSGRRRKCAEIAPSPFSARSAPSVECVAERKSRSASGPSFQLPVASYRLLVHLPWKGQPDGRA